MKKGVKGLICILGILFFCLATLACAGHHGHGDHGKKRIKKGILLAAFGSTIKKAQVSFANIEKQAKRNFRGMPIRWAYTSSIIRNKMARRGKQLDSIEMALAKMMNEGFTHVAIQSLHTIPGYEFHDLRKSVSAFMHMPDGISKITLGAPLLTTQKDIEAVVKAIIRNIPRQRRSNEAVVLMGHGTHHPGNAFYAALMFQLQQKDPNIFVGTVEGWPEIDEIKTMLGKKRIRKAWLMPFMSVAGDHTINDMAGDEKDSWKSVLTRAGIRCIPILKGTAEYDNIVHIWIKHLKTAVAHLESRHHR